MMSSDLRGIPPDALEATGGMLLRVEDIITSVYDIIVTTLWI